MYKGDDVCHNVLNIFAEQFGRALSRAGKKVKYFDCEKQDIGELTLYMTLFQPIPPNSYTSMKKRTEL
jgi:hypothetical protein